jgi:hypothetical protein
MKKRLVHTGLFRKVGFWLKKAAYRYINPNNYRRNDGNYKKTANLLDLGTVGSTPTAINLIHILNEIVGKNL